MSAIHTAIDQARPGGVEGQAALRPGGIKKKGSASSQAESPFAAILAQARNAANPESAAKPAIANSAQVSKLKAGAAGTAYGEALVAEGAAAKAAKASRAAAPRDPATLAPDASLSPPAMAQRPAPAAARPKAEAGLEVKDAIGETKAKARGQSASAGEAAAKDYEGNVALKAGPAKRAAPPVQPAEAAGGGLAARGLGGRDSRAAGPGEAEGPRGGEARLGVLDLRRSASGRKEAAAGATGASAKAGEAEVPARDEAPSIRKEVTREIGIGQAGLAQGDRPGRAEDASAPARAAGPDFSSMLAQRLRESGNGEIVQAAHIVLKDGDAGTIRLKLRPESLGDVKIELNLSDKSISGKIVVESDEAKSAFERNMAELSDAFRRGGFETASLEVSVGSGSGRESGGEGRPGSKPFFSERLRAAEGVAGPVASGAYARRGGAVDILA